MEGASPQEERIIGRALVEGVLTAPQVEECRRIRRELSATGLVEPLLDILVRKGYLVQSQLQSLNETAPPSQAKRFGNYEILSKVGTGGMGAVYRARQVLTGRIVALKVLNPHFLGNPNAVARFHREAQSLARISHPNIVAIFDVGTIGDTHYFAMEFIEGEPLSSILQRDGKRSEEETRRIAIPIASALQYIHSRGMLHRDIKPANILIPPLGEIKLCDFGLAKTGGADASITQVGARMGTPFYMSPEQIKGVESIDNRSDLYSLGATLYHIVTGAHPFEGRNSQSFVSKNLPASAPVSMERLTDIKGPLRAVIGKLVQKDPDRRYQSAADLLNDLSNLKSSASPILAKEEGMAPAPQDGRMTKRRGVSSLPRERSGSPAPVIVVLVLIGAIAVGFFLLSSRETSAPVKQQYAAPSDSGRAATARPPRAETPPAPVAASPEKPLPQPPPIQPTNKEIVETEVAKLLKEADETFKAGDYRSALRGYEKLVKEHEMNKLVVERIRGITENIAAAKGAVRRMEADAIAAEKDANDRIRRGEFAKALEAYRKLIERYPFVEKDEAVAARTRFLEREVTAFDLLEKSKKAFDEGKWEESATLLRDFHDRSAGTSVEKERGAAAAEMLAGAGKEIAATAALTLIADCRKSGAFEDALKAAEEFTSAHAGTATARNVDMAKMHGEIEAAIAKVRDERAQETWERSEKAVGENKFREAADLLNEFEKQFHDTNFAKTHDAKKELKELGRRRDQAAAKAFAEAQKLRKSDPDGAMEKLFALLETFPDAAWMTAKRRGEIDAEIDQIIAKSLVGTVELSASLKGYILINAKYGFSAGGSAQVSAGDLASAVGGEISGDAFVKLMKPLFAGANVTGGSLKGTRSGRNIDLHGSIVLRCSAGAAGDAQVSANLSGKMEFQGGKISSVTLNAGAAAVKSSIGKPGAAEITISSR